MPKPDMLRKGLVMVILGPAIAASAGDLLRGGAAIARRSAPTTQDAATSAAAESLRANARDSLARTTSTLNAIRAMQTAARAAAMSGPNNLGPDPNHPGLTLPDVPDGLTPGGLEVDPAVSTNASLWTGADQPVQAGSNVTITQTDQQAVLNWRTFNVGRNTTVHFDQSAGGERVGEWIAFNKVNDPSGVPSQILGSITAPGQVYIINQNGIIFGGSSQVNVHALVASSLPINDNLIARGLLNNPDAQFLFSALPVPAGNKGTPGFTPPAPSTPDGHVGDVVVQPGAQITAPTTVDHVGGRVVLVGANVQNSGTISTPDGQTILAAGLQVGFDAHSSNDPSLRGLDVYIGAVIDASLNNYAGTATNDGLIEAYRGNVTIAGRNVDQLGGIESTTSVSLNGRIDLIASYDSISNTRYDASGAKGPVFLQRSTGTVTLGPGSATQILPEWSSSETSVGTQLPLQSQVNITGLAVHLGAGSTVLAPNARVTVSAGVWDYLLNANEGRNQFVRSAGQVFMDSGAMINVAGSTDVAVAMAQYILSVELRGAELADAPVQRTGVLRGPTLTVDLRQTGTYNGKSWVGTPLADLAGYVGLVQRTAGELTADGGSVSISAGESVVMQPGSIVDVSGGFLNYEGGFIETTRVIQGGRLVPIAEAVPDQVYDVIYTGTFTTGSSRWGVTETYAIPWMSGRHYEAGYVHGAAGGSVSIQAPAMAIDGELRGNTVTGPRQREANPVMSSLTLKFTGETLIQSGQPAVTISPTPPAITFAEDSQLPAAAAFELAGESTMVNDVLLTPGTPVPLSEERKKNVVLSPDLLAGNGFGSLTVENGDGGITVPLGVSVKAPPAGSITLSASNISVLGSISAPAGAVSMTVYNFSPYLQTVTNEDPLPDKGGFVLGPDAGIHVAGLLIDDRLTAPAPFSEPLGVNVRNAAGQIETRSTLTGGSVSINSYHADLAPGSVIDASGGVWMSVLNKLTYGNGGSISIKAGKDPLRSVLGGHLNLGSTLRGFSAARGASLTLQAPVIQAGGTAAYADTLLLQPEFFSQGGFSSFTLIGIGADLREPGEVIPEGEPAEKYAPAVTIAPGTVIEPVVQSVFVDPLVPGSDTFSLTTMVKEPGYRNAVNLSFQTIDGGVTSQVLEQAGVLKVRGDIVMGVGSRIVTDPLGSVSFIGQTVAIHGSVTAPGGTITVSGANKFPSRVLEPAEAFPTVHLSGTSSLSTKGTTVLVADRFGRRTGTVLPGGTIKVSGNIVADPGAWLDVSGTSAVLDVHPSYLNLDTTLGGEFQPPLVPVTSGLNAPLYASLGVPHKIDSNAGAISFKGGEMLFTQATLKGEAGGPAALGGTLSISSGRFVDQRDDRAITLVVGQDAARLPVPVLKDQPSPIGQPLRDADEAKIPSLGYFAADSFLEGGFDSLILDGNVEFRGPVTIGAKGYIKAGLGGIIQADDVVSLSAPYVAIGRAFQTPFLLSDNRILFEGIVEGQPAPVYFPPSYGTGVLNITADTIDIGTLSLQGIGAASLYAKNDIRGNGTFNIAGDLKLIAGQIYPTTASAFTIVAYDYVTKEGEARPGTVTLGWSGVERDLPLSAGGQLNIFGSLIHQGGVLRAPIGGINIGWDGTGTAPVNPLTNQAVPVTRTLTLAGGSITSVSAVNSSTGEASLIPYGLVTDGGTSWIDPTGANITAGGIVGKSVTLSAGDVTTQSGSLVDISGGGDLLAYSFVKGNGGSTDILASTGSFAVIPGYDSNYAPYAPFNTNSNFGGDPGYVNNTLQTGDRVYLSGSDSLAAGVYTLLPARYALLPGAVLVTPKSGQPVGTFQNPDGSFFVSGYRFNDLDAGRDATSSLYSRFEVASAAVVSQRAKYDVFSANIFLKNSALKVDSPVPRLPVDGGYLLFQSTQAMSLRGDVYGYSHAGGRGGVIDVSTPIDIVIAGPGAEDQPGKLVLDSSLVSRWGAESILIGGSRTFGTNGPGSATVKVVTSSITVDNAGAPLTGPEIILAATRSLTLAPGSQIEQQGSLGGKADFLFFGDPAVPGSGNGTMLRVSSDETAEIHRFGVTQPGEPVMTIGSGASIKGASIILDSTHATSLDANASILGDAISLHSGQISIQLDNPGELRPTVGLVLSGSVLEGLRSAKSLSLLSYSSIDIYGTGEFSTRNSLAMHAGEIRGFNTNGGAAVFSSGEIKLDNIAGAASAGPVVPMSGSLVFAGDIIRLQEGQLNIQHYSDVQLSASGGMVVRDRGGLAVQGSLTAVTPLITGEKASTYTLSAAGALNLLHPGTVAAVEGGLGASLSLKASSINATSGIHLPSGTIDMQTTNGGITIGGSLDVSGTAQGFYDVVDYTDAGRINLSAAKGGVQITSGGLINVSAHPEGGDAGTISINAPDGEFVLGGVVLGQGGRGGANGSFNLDARSVPDYAALNAVLNDGAFTESRVIRLRTGSVLLDGVTTARTFRLSTDAGSITVSGTVDASGPTGGTIDLKASGSVTLLPGAILNASGQAFSAAGKGGAVYLEAGSQINGAVNTAARVSIQTGSMINLGVAANTTSSQLFGQFTGSLHIRAPQVAAGNELQIDPLNGSIIGASKIEVEGYKLFDLTPAVGVTNATITTTVQNSVKTNGTTFGNAINAITSRIIAGNAGLASVLVVMPGAEIINRTGSLTLGTSASSPVVNDWNLQTFRFGPKGAPGVLTLRAAGDLVFYNALSDGFDSTKGTSTNALEKLWTAPLMTQSALLPVNAQSWSYRLVAGADFGAADFHEVQSPDALGTSGRGSLMLGQNAGQATVTGGVNATTRQAINPTNSTNVNTGSNRFQVIRTGSGDIDVVAGRDVQLLNQFATIYTAGTQVASPTAIYSAGDFVTPIVTFASSAFIPNQGGVLGAQQQQYPAQYSLAGGNVTVSAQADILHLTKDSSGNLIIDSSRQLPENWLYRRSYVDPATGQYGSTGVSNPSSVLQQVTDPAASTTWWIDFSNFFSGIAALGGGDVTLTAGRDIQNVDAHAPTNARAPSGTPDASRIQELGGGDLTVIAGRNIDGGVYYVERGTGTLIAGGAITTNSTRSPSLGRLQSTTNPSIEAEQLWLPTTLFVGKSTFDVSARGDVLLGPAVNAFWLPQGINNKHWYKTYFTTYSADSAVNVTSLGGNVTLRESATVVSGAAPVPVLQNWLAREMVPNTVSTASAASFQPWLRVIETSATQFETVYSAMPPTLRVSAFSGDVNIVGDINLFPSATGSLEILARGAINGLQPVGVSSTLVPGQKTTLWASSTINLSDASPLLFPGVTNPFSYYSIVGRDNTDARTTSGDFLLFIERMFTESGSSTGSFATIQSKQALHASGPLHVSDDNPVNVYAGTGSISGFTLFSSKSAQIIAGKDITDVGFYIQNVRDTDVSVVSSGRDIILYNPNSPLRVKSQTGANLLATGGETVESGDIQISGPGALQVLAGRNLDLGSGANNPDGTGVGILSIGNARNPYLPFTGADVTVAAGLGSAGLLSSNLDFDTFIGDVIHGANGGRYLSELADPLTLAEFDALSLEEQRRRALSIFFIALRDAGRDHNDLGLPYDNGFSAIDALFSSAGSHVGDISLTAREIKTRAGGDISILAPGGKLSVGIDRPGTQSLEQGILTERGGSISVFAGGNVDLGTSRIFTLRGGDIVIWSSTGDIAAGASSKTVQSAPPTRVVIDAQSANVQVDLSGLATGGGIGVLDTVVGVPPGNVDLIAPVGVVDAGDAGIRSSGNLNIAATAVLNASNISVAGVSTGTPAAPVVAAPNIGGLTSASNTAGASAAAAEAATKAASRPQEQPRVEQLPSIINVEVLGYGGGEGGDEDERKKREPGAQ